ncbi:hypothetical protein B0J14DRAFT_31495 [Halenospora varia]|nr:hypothetical protein B0J14DRAFT_31495 [Halenospora varia]
MVSTAQQLHLEWPPFCIKAALRTPQPAYTPHYFTGFSTSLGSHRPLLVCDRLVELAWWAPVVDSLRISRPHASGCKALESRFAPVSRACHSFSCVLVCTSSLCKTAIPSARCPPSTRSNVPLCASFGPQILHDDVFLRETLTILSIVSSSSASTSGCFVPPSAGSPIQVPELSLRERRVPPVFRASRSSNRHSYPQSTALTFNFPPSS